MAATPSYQSVYKMSETTTHDTERWLADCQPDPVCYYCGKRSPLKTDSLGRYICRSCLGPVPFRATPRPGRNDPCPCGSGDKYKRCCARSGRASADSAEIER